MEGRNVIVIILCFLLAGCLPQFHGFKLESQARSHMERAAALEDSSSYHQAAQEYAIVAERYPSTSYYKHAVWKAHCSTFIRSTQKSITAQHFFG